MLETEATTAVVYFALRQLLAMVRSRATSFCCRSDILSRRIDQVGSDGSLAGRSDGEVQQVGKERWRRIAIGHFGLARAR